MKQMSKRFWSLLLCAALMLTMLPTAAFAAGGDPMSTPLQEGWEKIAGYISGDTAHTVFSPISIAVNESSPENNPDIYVTSSRYNYCVMKGTFNTNTYIFNEIANPAFKSDNIPISVAIDGASMGDGNVYVATNNVFTNPIEKKIWKFNGTSWTDITYGLGISAPSLAAGVGNLYAAESNSRKLSILWNGSTTWQSIQLPNIVDGLVAVAIPHPNIYSEVYVLDKVGRIWCVTFTMFQPLTLDKCTLVATAPSGGGSGLAIYTSGDTKGLDFYVTDASKKCIQALTYATNGKLPYTTESWVVLQNGSSNAFNGPAGIALDGWRNMYVVDPGATMNSCAVFKQHSVPRLSWTTQPGNGISVGTLSRQPLLKLEYPDDNGGYKVATGNSVNQVTVTLTSGSGTLSGTQTVTLQNGVATFSNLGVTGPGTYTLTATCGGLSSVSNSFTVDAATYGISLDKTGTQTFASQTTGYSSVTPLPVKVSNTANQATGNLTVALSGANPGNFTLPKIDIGSIATGGSGTFTVVPNDSLSAGIYTATVTVSGSNVTSQTFAVIFTVNAAPVIAGVSAATSPIAAAGGTSVITVTGTDLTDGIKVTAFDGATTTAITSTTTGNGTSQTVTLAFPENTSTTADKVYTIKASLDNGSNWDTQTATVTVSKAAAPAPAIAGVSAATSPIAAVGGTSVITVTGTNLPNGIKVTAFDGTTPATPAITGTTTGSGTNQTVTLAFPENTSTTADKVYTIKASLDNGNTWDTQTATVTVSKVSVIDATISPISANYDLASPSDISTNITLNSATTVTDVVYATASMLMPTDYVVSGNVLIIKNSYLAAQGFTAGNTAAFTISFDKGASSTLSVNIVNNYIPGSNSDLSGLTAGGSTVSSFDPNTTSYNVDLPYGTQPGSAATIVSATTSDTKATVTITQAISLPGSATVKVTAEDSTTTKTYTINFTLKSAPPVQSSEKDVTSVTTPGGATISGTSIMAMVANSVTSQAISLSVSAGASWKLYSDASCQNEITNKTMTLSDGANMAYVRVNADDGSTKDYTLTITRQGSVPSVILVTGISITGGSAIATKSGTLQLAADVMPVSATNKTVTWSIVSGSSYALLSPTGLLAALSNGSVTVRATAQDGSGVYGELQVAISGQGGSGSSGSNGGGSSGGGTPLTPSTPNYKADVNAGNGSNTTLPVTVDQNNGTASVDFGIGSGLISGGKTTVVTVPSVPDVDTYTLGVLVPNLATSNEQGKIAFKSDNGSVTIPTNMLTGVVGISGSKAQISIGEGDKTSLPAGLQDIIGERPLIQLTLSIDGKQADWSNPDAPVMVSIPYTPTADELKNPEGIVICYIDGSGKAVSVPNGRYDPATRTVTFFTTHFSDYAVGYNPVSFNDVATGAWYNKAVSFIAARGITTGTGNGKYNPEAKLTRGEFIVLMMRAYGIAPDGTPKDNFSDAGNTYYTGYLAAAKRLGIAGGIGNNMFAPDKEITRQEMFTLLYNALKVMDMLPEGTSGKALTDFSDTGDIASWAKDTMTLFVKTGTVTGNGGKLSPTNTTTRAEMAQMLYNLLSK